MGFVVLNTELVVVGAHYTQEAILGYLNAIINCRNGVMQLTFSNMTPELNIFHLSKKHVHQEEEGLEEVCLIDTIVEEQCGQQ